MHGPSIIKQMNDEVRADLKLIPSQGEYIVIPQTKKGAQFISSHYPNHHETLGGRRISADEHMTLVASKAEAFGIVIHHHR